MPPPTPLFFKLFQSTASSSSSSFTKEAIVLLHGMLGSSSNFLTVARALQRNTGLDVLVPDARNHGRSPHTTTHTYADLAEDLRGFLDERGLEKGVTLIGHSMGARTAMLLSLVDRPKAVDRLVVLDASPVHPTPKAGVDVMKMRLKAMEDVDMDEVSSKAKGGAAEAREVAGRWLKERGVTRDDMREALLTNLRRDPRTGRCEWQVNVGLLRRELEDHLLLVPQRERWRRFEGRTFFLGGERSGYVPLDSHGEIREAAFPEATFDYVTGAGHWMYREKPEEFMEKLTRFLMEE